MEFGLTDEQRAIRDTVRDFVRKELSPASPRCWPGTAAASPG
ncbi:acyl-CoA dehydrogenase family protein [Actinocatenispora thailandica]|nr:acyl-CoA dehydrogenase family protein [Actinocatenispora thailandica]